MRFTVSRVGLTILVGCLWACDSEGEPTSPPVSHTTPPTSLHKVAGDGQTGLPGSTLPVRIVAQVLDANQRGVAGITVAFISSGTGSVSPATAVSDASGRVEVLWTIGFVEGRDTLTAHAPDLQPIEFSAVVLPGAGHTETISLGSVATIRSISIAPGNKGHIVVQAPPQAFQSEQQLTVKTRSVRPSELPSGAVALAPLIDLSGPSLAADSAILFQIPLLGADRAYPNAFSRSPGGVLRPLPVIDFDSASITVAIRLFSTLSTESMGAPAGVAGDGGITILALSSPPPPGMITTGFAKGVDNWEFTNWGTEISPTGSCLGMSATMGWYYFARTLTGSPPLYDRFGTRSASVILEHDNRWFRLTGMLTNTLQRPFSGLETKTMSDHKSWDLLVSAMSATKEPAFLLMTGGFLKAGLAHAAVVRSVDPSTGGIWIADPNIPDPAKDPPVEYDLTTKKFKEYCVTEKLCYSNFRYFAWDANELQEIGQAWRDFESDPTLSLGFTPVTISVIDDESKSPIPEGAATCSRGIRVKVDQKGFKTVVLDNLGDPVKAWPSPPTYGPQNYGVLVLDESVLVPVDFIEFEFTSTYLEWQSDSLPAITEQEPFALTAYLVDARGQLVDLAASPAGMVELFPNPVGATLRGATAVSTIGGRAAFTNLVIDRAGAGFFLRISGADAEPLTLGPFSVAPASTDVASVSIVPSSATITVGESVQLTATPLDSAGHAIPFMVVNWTSSNAAVAPVSSGGLVRGVAVGAVTITATAGGASGTAIVTVMEPPDCPSPVRVDRNIDSATTWTSGPVGCVHYQVTRDIYVRAPLMVQAGTTVAFAQYAGITVSSEGSLTAVGTETSRIRFMGEQAVPGYWDGLRIWTNSAANELTYVEVAHGGFGSLSTSANVQVSGRLQLTHSILDQGGNLGLYASSSATLPGFASNTFRNNGASGIRVPARLVGSLDTSSTYDAGNGTDFIEVDAAIIGDADTWHITAVPLRIKGDVSVRAGLTIIPGVTLLFAQYAGITVSSEGSLTAVGTETSRIRFMGEQAVPGYWDGLRIWTNSAANELTYVEVAHGGFGSLSTSANVQVASRGLLRLTNSIIRDSLGWGLYIDSSSTVTPSPIMEAGNVFSNNARGDIGP